MFITKRAQVARLFPSFYRGDASLRRQVWHRPVWFCSSPSPQTSGLTWGPVGSLPSFSAWSRWYVCLHEGLLHPPRLRFVNAPHSRQRVAAMNKTRKDIKNNLCSGWGQVSLHKRKSCFQCLMPNVSLNKKKQRSLLHIKPDNDMHVRNYIKKTLTLFQSVHVIHLHVIHSHVILYKLMLRKSHLIMFNRLSENYILYVCFDSKSKWKTITFILIVREHLLCGIRDEDGNFLPLPSPWTHVYSLYIVYL